MSENNVVQFKPPKDAIVSKGSTKAPIIGDAVKATAKGGELFEFPTAGLHALIEHYSGNVDVALTYDQVKVLRRKRKLIGAMDKSIREILCLQLGLAVYVRQIKLAQNNELVNCYRVIVYNGPLLKPTRHALIDSANEAECVKLIRDVLASTYNTLHCLARVDGIDPHDVALTIGSTSTVFATLLDASE